MSDKTYWDSLQDFVVYFVVAVVLGYLLNLLFPYPGYDEPEWLTFVMCFVQLFVVFNVIYFVEKLHEEIFTEKLIGNIGFVIFVTVFLIAQHQLIYRFILVFCYLTNYTFTMGKSYQHF